MYALWRARDLRPKWKPVEDAEPLPESRPLTEAAKRALAEAQARREAEKADRPRELGGRGGLDPARYGDWEVKGIACDF